MTRPDTVGQKYYEHAKRLIDKEGLKPKAAFMHVARETLGRDADDESVAATAASVRTAYYRINTQNKKKAPNKKVVAKTTKASDASPVQRELDNLMSAVEKHSERIIKMEEERTARIRKELDKYKETV